MTRSLGPLFLGLRVIAFLVVVQGCRAQALGPEDDTAAAAARSEASPLLAALAYAPAGTYSFDFTDRAALKALHGSADVTSASPLEERQRLVLGMVDAEASGSGFGLDQPRRRLPSLPGRPALDRMCREPRMDGTPQEETSMRRVGAALAITLSVGLCAGVAAAQPEAPVEPANGVRLYLAEAGIGLTIPDGWTVQVDHHRADPPPDQPMPAAERWFVLTASDGSAELDGCRLFRYESAGLTLAQFGSALMSGQPSTVTPVQLDAGEALRIELELGGPDVAQQYVLRSGDTFYQLACLTGDGAPDVRWQSIAESLEALPSEE